MLNEIRDKIIKHVQQSSSATSKFEKFSYDEWESLIFCRPGSTRLTYTGYLMLSKILNFYTFDHNLPTTAKIYMGLSKIRYPFYLNAQIFISFSEEEALLLKLHGGDLAMFLEKIGESFED